jgi:hypothetical protein
LRHWRGSFALRIRGASHVRGCGADIRIGAGGSYGIGFCDWFGIGSGLGGELLHPAENGETQQQAETPHNPSEGNKMAHVGHSTSSYALRMSALASSSCRQSL